MTEYADEMVSLMRGANTELFVSICENSTLRSSIAAVESGNSLIISNNSSILR